MVVALGLMTLGAVARWLEPNPEGLGTHQQLGLPPCTFRMLFGRRCPSCGMTTSWAYLTRGDLRSAAAANSGGAVLGILCLAAVPWCLWHGWRGVKGRLWLEDWMALCLAVGLIAVTLIDWGWRF